MNRQAIRSYVMALYPNVNWHRKVHNMSDNQVYAIYRTSLERKQKEEANKTIYENHKKEDFHQVDIFEWLNERSKND